MALRIVCTNNVFRGNPKAIVQKKEFKFPNESFQKTHSKIEKHYNLVTSTFSDFEKKRMERLRKYVTMFQEDIKEIDMLSREMVNDLKKDSETLEKEINSDSNENLDDEITTDIIKREHDKYFE